MKILEDFKKDYYNSINEFKKTKSLKTQVPNLLCLTRAITPIITIPLVLTGNSLIALIIAGLSASTDFFDGKLARKFNCVNEFGRKLDTICDKIFAVGMIVPLLSLSPSLIPIVLLECVIASVNLYYEHKGCNTKTNMLGKIKTTSLSITVILHYLDLIINIPINAIVSSLAITIALQIQTSVKYYQTNKKTIDETKNELTIENSAKTVKAKKLSEKEKQILKLKDYKRFLENEKNKQIEELNCKTIENDTKDKQKILK